MRPVRWIVLDAAILSALGFWMAEHWPFAAVLLTYAYAGGTTQAQMRSTNCDAVTDDKEEKY